MSFELANLIVTIAADGSAVAEALGQVRSELENMSSTAAPSINLGSSGAEATTESIKALQATVSELQVPTKLTEDLEKTTEQSKELNKTVGLYSPPLNEAATATEGLAGHFHKAASAAHGLSTMAARATLAAIGLGRNMAGIGATHPTPKGLTNLTLSLRDGSTAAGSLITHLASIGGIDLSNLLQLGTLAGMATGIGSLVEKFTQMEDEATVLPMRLRNAGVAGEDMMKKIRGFRDSLASTGMATRKEITDVIEQAAMRGPEKFRGQWENTVQSAFQLAAANGKSVQYNMQMLNLGQQNFTNMQRMFRLLGISMRPHATMAEYQQTLNDKIKEGGVIMDAVQKTWGAQFKRVENSISGLKGELAQVIGPALAPGLKFITDLVIILTQRIRDFVDANRSQVEGWARVASGIFGTISAIMTLKAAFLLWATVGPTIISLFSPVLSVMMLFTRVSMLAGMALRAMLIPIGLLRMALPLLAGAIKSAIAATGVGLILVLIGGILHATGALEYLIKLVKDFVDAVRGNQLGGMMSGFTSTWAFITKEFKVFVNALYLGFYGVLNALYLQVLRVSRGIAQMFGMGKMDMAAWTSYLMGKLSQLGTFLFQIWREIAAEISVAGLRLQQGFLLFEVVAQNIVPIFNYIVALYSALWGWIISTVWERMYEIWTVATTVIRVTFAFILDIISGLMAMIFRNWKLIRDTWQETAQAIGMAILTIIVAVFAWIFANFPKLIMFLVNLVFGMIIQIWEFAYARLKEFWEASKDPTKWAAKGFDFTATKAEIEKTKKALGDIFSKELKLPDLKVGGPAADEVKKIQNQIDAEKKKFKDEQDKIAKGIKDKEKEPPKPPPKAEESPVGKQIAGGFGDLMGQWKKIQEAAGGGKVQTLEDLAKKQHAEQREGNKKLDDIKKQMEDLNGNIKDVGKAPVIPE